MPICKSPVVAALLIFLFHGLKAQTNDLYSYQDLSQFFYAKQKDSLKKAWTCPSIYKDKATQKKYKEIWDERTDFVTTAIAKDDYVYDPEVFGYIDGIVNQIVQANSSIIPVKPFLLIDRSPSVNAYSVGGNIIAVNLGMITFATSREELALAIAHELSHNILAHPENSMKKRAEWLTSDEYKNSLNAILDSKYERLSRLRKVFENYSFDRSRHQRYHESDADSLAIVLLKNSSISFDAAFFLRLDSADIQYKQPLHKTVKDYFGAYNLAVEDVWIQKRSRGLSTRNYNFKDTVRIQDSLKTHPDCIERYKRTLVLNSKDMKRSPVPASIRDRASKMLIWNMYCNMNLTPCLYRILLEKEKGNKDAWYDFMTHNIVAGLFFADKELHRFSAIGVTPKEYISKDYYELQTMFEQIPRSSLEQYYRTLQNADFWGKMSQQEKALKGLMYTLAFDAGNSDKNKASAVKEFMKHNSGSPYCEFAEPFGK